MQLLKIFLLSCSLLVIIVAAASHEKTDIGVAESLAQFRIDSKIFSASITELGDALKNINSAKPETVLHAKKTLIFSRIAYKRIEYLLEYFFFTSSRIYNRAPKNEIEEPYLEYQEPAGLQYIEAMLFDSIPEKNRGKFQEQIRLLSLASNDLNSLLYQFKRNDAQILESVRIELIRIISLGITGFDAPLLKTGIAESEASLKSIQKTLIPYFKLKKSKSDSTSFYLNRSIEYLNKNPDFNTFNRLDFLTENALPLQNYLGKMIRDMDLEINKDGILNYRADHIFSQDAFDTHSFQNNKKTVSQKQIDLGKKLFFETGLSGNSKKSCASCHNPDKYFTDGLAKSIGFETHHFVKRNAPSLLYSSLQHNQFWDGRVKNLEEQIENVMQDSLEMSGKISVIIEKLNADKIYRKTFRKAFSKGRKDNITDHDIYKAIASYIKTLTPFNAPFDKYIEGNKKAMTENQVAGFNLFMGKAQCGTCHFAPLFNGLIPPAYALTEFEIIGTTGTDNLAKPEYDNDNGRFDFRATPFYKGAFKTPTVRNSAVTGPYMHNGAFDSLETLMEFYNQGGGAGLGLTIPNQTLSSAKLNLTEKEKKDIIEFLYALTDDLIYYN